MNSQYSSTSSRSLLGLMALSLEVISLGSSSWFNSSDEISSGDLISSVEKDAAEKILSGQPIEHEEADEGRHVLRDHFNNLTSFQYEQSIGSGVFGVAHSVIEKRFARSARRFVIKRAQSQAAEDELRNEIKIMTRLNGSAHIARVIAAKDSDWSTQPRGAFRRLVAKVKGRKNMLAGLLGPAIALEHLDNGSVERLLASLVRRQKGLPNRVLWSFFLCLVRACIAMRYPPGQPYGARPKLEEIPENQPGMGIMHADMHVGNILIGSVGGFPEHALVPPMKLIDFGLSLIRRGDLCDQRNLLDAGKQIYYLITGKVERLGFQNEIYHGVNTMATGILPHDGRDPYPMLDRDLRNLVVRCLAKDPKDRPSLAEALGICKNAVETKTSGSYGSYEALETDRAIGTLLQEIIYDAS